MKRPVSMIVVVLLFLLATLHLCRLIFPVEIIVGGTYIPQWVSIVGFLVPSGLAILLKRESRG